MCTLADAVDRIQWNCLLPTPSFDVWLTKWLIIINCNMSPSQATSFFFVPPTPECCPLLMYFSDNSPETRLSELSKTVRISGSSASSTIAPEDGVPTNVSTPEIKQIMKRVPGKSARDGEDDA